ncbi:hypothetical protein F5148DRAFT_1367300 [Russula earlei]|uniref:Uncharacterized protein n=1 Tax=Russula earlei TaxID=71964 RepID=A0ACC0UCH8_9AGAM|nr:hypothetical protein F5148DRAFT_1367300 [Russula earlei]
MASPLPTGLYEITNAGIGQSVGQSPGKPLVKPIVGTDERPIWRVTLLDGNLYHLDIHGFVTRNEDNLVSSYLLPEIVATKWIIEGGSDGFTIVVPDGHMLRYWTLSERDTQVSLPYREGMVPGPNQYWNFTHFVDE